MVAYGKGPKKKTAAASPDEPVSKRVTAAERYTELAVKREESLARFRRCAELTIPTLMPPDGTDGEDLVTPAQSNGARGVNSLSANILLATVPPNQPVFRLETGDAVETIMELAADDPSLMQDSEEAQKLAESARQVRKNLDRIPRMALRLAETYKHRPIIFEGFKHLVVGGNILFWFLDDKKNYGKMRAVPLSRYVVLRDGLAFPLEIVVRDSLSAANLPPKLKEIQAGKMDAKQILEDAAKVKTDSATSQYALYTYACWYPDEEKYHFCQEFMGEIVPGSEAKYTEVDFPLLPLRFYSADGEDYGRGLVEEYEGPLMSIEALAQAETALAIAMSDVRLCVGAASGIRARDIISSPVGQPLDCEPDTIKALSYEAQGDLAAIMASKVGLQREVSIAFLDRMAIQRSGERVTAEEWRTLTLTLDNSLGGLQSALSVDFLTPYSRFQLRILKKVQGITPDQFSVVGEGKTVMMSVVTGLDALGKLGEMQNFIEAQRAIMELIGPEAYAAHANVAAIADRINGFRQIESAGLYKSDAQLAQIAAAEQQAQTNQAIAPTVVDNTAKMAMSVAEQQAAA